MTHTDLLGAFMQCVLEVGSDHKSGPWIHYAIQTSLTSVRNSLLLIFAAAFFGYYHGCTDPSVGLSQSQD